MPPDVHLPKQGWKIHSSGTLDNAEEIVSIVWDYCVPRGIPFKFVRSRQLLLLRNGLYAGTDKRTGETVVLKEARPHAGLAVDGADAVARLQRERDMLQRLAGLDCVPAVRDYFILGDHHFLVLDFVDG